MVNFEAACELIDIAEGEGRAGDFGVIAQAGGQALDEGGFTAAEVGGQFDNFATVKQPAKPGCHFLGFVGAGSIDFVGHSGIRK